MLALHQVISELGLLLDEAAIKAHILTGHDCLSKVGTKRMALAYDPVQ